MVYNQLSNTTGLLMTAVIVVLILYDIRNDLYRVLSGRTMVLLAILLWYMLEAVRVPDDLTVYTQSQYDTGIAVVGLALVVFLVGYHNSRLRIFDDVGRRLVHVDNDNIIWALFVFGCCVGFGPMIYYADFQIAPFFEGLWGVDKRWTGPWARGRFGGLREALLELQMFLDAVVPFAAIILFSSRSPALRRGICLFFITWMLLRANSSGARSAVFPIVMPVCAAIFWKSSHEMRKWLILLGLPAAIVAAYFYSAMIVSSRNSGEVEISETLEAADDYTGFEMFRELLFILEEVPDSVDYQWGKSYANQVINPIPRYFWEDKPKYWDAGYVLAIAKGNVDETGYAVMTNSPGFIGETYLNFGLAGLVIIPFVSGLVIRSWDRLLASSGKSFLMFVVFAGGLANILASGRSISISTYYGMIALYVLLIVIETMTTPAGGNGHRRGRSNRRARVPA